MKLIIRDFVSDDKDEYIKMSEAFFNSYAVDHTVPAEHFQSTFDQCINASPYTRGMALISEGIFAGYALASFTWSNEAGGICVWIEELYIQEESRGYGIGKAFLEFIESEYAGKAKRLRLEVTLSNSRAAELYRNLGYTELDYCQLVKDFHPIEK